MLDSEKVETLARISPLSNLFVLADEIQSHSARLIAEWFYGGIIDRDLTVDMLTAIVF